MAALAHMALKIDSRLMANKKGAVPTRLTATLKLGLRIAIEGYE